MTPAERDLFIRTVYGESGGEPLIGQAAVANVIKNRLSSGKYGGSIGDIITPDQFNGSPISSPIARNLDPGSAAYQTIGHVVDGVMAGRIGDPTGGATNFYAQRLASPSWAGTMTNARQIGNQTFGVAPDTGGMKGGSGAYLAQVAQARDFLRSISDHPDRQGDTAYIHPAFAVKLATAIQDARSQGLNLKLMSGYRAPNQLASTGDTSSAAAYDAGGNSSHSYGIAVDIGGLDGANGPVTQRWAKIAANHGLSNPYGIDNAKEFNHWQLLPYALETRPEQLASLKKAAASGDWNAVWNVAQPVDTVVAAGGARTGGGATTPVVPPLVSGPLATLGLALQNTFSQPNLSGGDGSQVVDPPDQPAIRTAALGGNDYQPENDLTTSMGLGSSLGKLGAADTEAPPTLTQGAPAMSGLFPNPGYAQPMTGVGELSPASQYPAQRYSRLG